MIVKLKNLECVKFYFFLLYLLVFEFCLACSGAELNYVILILFFSRENHDKRILINMYMILKVTPTMIKTGLRSVDKIYIMFKSLSYAS